MNENYLNETFNLVNNQKSFKRGNMMVKEIYNEIIQIDFSNVNEWLDFLTKAASKDELAFLEVILKVAIMGSCVVPHQFKNDKFNRYISKILATQNGWAVEYDLSNVINDNLSKIANFITDRSTSRRFYISLAKEEDADWPPSMVGIHILSKGNAANFTAFSRSLDIDFLRVDLLYYLTIIKNLTETIQSFDKNFKGIDFALHISNLYKGRYL